MKRSILHIINGCSIALLVSACSMGSLTELESDPEEAASLPGASTDNTAINVEKSGDPVGQDGTAPAQPVKTHRRQPVIEIGKPYAIQSPRYKSDQTAPAIEEDITLNFQNTGIREFVGAILGDALQENFIIDSKVKGSITIETVKPVSKAALMSLLEEVLKLNNAVLLEKEGMYHILPKTNVLKKNLSLPINKPSDGYQIRIIPLSYISAKEMGKILQPLISKNDILRIDERRNILMLVGLPNTLNALQETINIFDIDWLKGMSFGFLPLNYVDANTLEKELKNILSSMDGGKKNGPLGGLVRVIAIERLNSILLISVTPAALREAQKWVQRLDVYSEQIGRRIYVYHLQNAKALELAEILRDIFSDSDKKNIAAMSTLAPGSVPVTIKDEQDKKEAPLDPLQQSIQHISNVGLMLPLSDNIKIIADDTRNALVILAKPQDYKAIAAAIRELDTVPLQVLVEASIIEVSLGGELKYGVEWFFKHGKFSDGHIGQPQLDLDDPGIQALSRGFAYTIINNAKEVRLAINALAKESTVNVLSTPSLMALDNQTATIKVGDEIPVPTRQSISNINADAPTVNEINYRTTGIILEVTPRVNNSGLVTMEISQEASTPVETLSSNISAPTIQQRTIKSTIAVSSGETIVLGGLISDTNSKVDSGIPGLYKMPVIGKLFGGTSIKKERKELIILLTPKVIKNNSDARRVINELRSKLKSMSLKKEIGESY